MNSVNLIGNFTRDGELKPIPNSDKMVFKGTLAVERKFKNADGKREADFINVIAFGKLSEIIANYSGKKSDKLGITGRIQTGSYKNKEDKTVYTFDVVIDDITFLGAKNSNTAAATSNTEFDAAPVDDGDIPF